MPRQRHSGLVRRHARIGCGARTQCRIVAPREFLVAGRCRGEQALLGRRYHRSSGRRVTRRNDRAEHETRNWLQDQHVCSGKRSGSYAGLRQMIVYQADWVCPASSPPIRNGCIAVDGDRITSVGPDVFTPDAERKRYPGTAIIPGFVNAHAHLELTLFRGLLDNLPFSDWIGRLTRMKYEQCTRDALK